MTDGKYESKKINKERHLDIDANIISTLLCYPKFDSRIYDERIKELENLNIDTIETTGKTIIRGINVLGKGYTSIVLKVKRKNETFALKIKRTDSPRINNKDEIFFLKKANSINIGPKLIDYTENFLLMEYIDGINIREYFNNLNLLNASTHYPENTGYFDKDKEHFVDIRSINLEVKKILKEILFQCYSLDRIHLDHGELSYIDNHVIVEKNHKIKIIDFESASLIRKTINLSSVVHSLLLFGPISQSIKEIIKLPEKNEIIKLVKKYKQRPSLESFNDIIRVIS